MTATVIEPAALTVDQAATYLGISTRTLYRITAECGTGKDDLPHVRLAGRRLFLRRDLDAYLEAHRVLPTSPLRQVAS